MPELLHPGVYVMEVPASVKPIEGQSTSTAGFIGVADRGPVPGFPMPFGAPLRPPLVTSFAEYTRLFGGYRQDSFLTYAVQNFFDNGGKRAYIVRVVNMQPGTGYGSIGARLAAVGLVDAQGAATLGVVANTPGSWANDVAVSVRPATAGAGSFKLVVIEGGVAVEQFDNLSMDSQSDEFADMAVNSRSQLIRVKVVIPTGVQAPAAVPAADPTLPLVGDTVSGTAKPSLTIASPTYLGGPLTITTKRFEGAQPTFDLTVLRNNLPLEVFQGLSMDPGRGNYAVTKINARSAYLTAAYNDASPPTWDVSASRPVDGTNSFTSSPLPANQYPLGSGADGPPLVVGDQLLLGSGEFGTGLHAFDSIADVNIIAIPGAGTDLVISGGMAYCKNRQLQDAFFVADLGALGTDDARTPDQLPSNNDKNDAAQFVRGLSTPNDYGAIYYPWIRASDPIGRGRNPTILLPPSGFISGLYARIDNSRGVFKAPAGTEAGLAGALGLAADISDADQDSLNPIGCNVIRRFPIYGIVTWGSRTLSADAAWRYVPVRRMAIFLRTSIYHGIQWAVFEGNDEPLWAELRLNIRAFMLTQFRAGAFQGSAPNDAFFVKCDASTTTQQDIDNGVVNILVGFAPLKPAEFVVLKLSQKVNQPAA
jgi:uncharacterized protein